MTDQPSAPLAGMTTPRTADQDAGLPKVLLTAFDAFGGMAVNPSWLAVRQVQEQGLDGHDLVAACLPTSFKDSSIELDRLLKLHRPSLVICTGVASGRMALSLERVAININDARIADNSGAQPVDEPVVPGGPAAYFSTLPIKAMLAALQHAGLPAEISQTAGTFVCNHIFFQLMHTLSKQSIGPRRVRGGFIHVPDIASPATPGMRLDDTARGLAVAMRCALQHESDIVIAGGAIA